MMPQSRFRIVHAVLVLFALAIIAKAAHVQLWQHERWMERAERQQLVVSTLPAPRGDIQDATGLSVAHSRELVRLSVAPPEVTDLRKLYKSMVSAGIPASEAGRATRDRQRKWIEVRGRYSPSSVAPLTRVNGVHMYDVGDRVYVQSDGIRRLVGAVARNGHGLSGLELQLDSLLQGRDGRSRTLRGKGGARFESPDMTKDLPRRGHTVRLTINQVLQDICDQSLADAVRRLAADGGDVVVLDPRSGAVRCMASLRQRRGASVTALIEPFEPGSTLKPFYAALLLERGLATANEVIETYNGRWEIHGRVINDVHREARMTLADVIRFSSNVGIAHFSERLSDGDMYQLLRDIGFGTPTGVPYPSEASGTLRHPRYWSRQSHASHAIGYELTVTPLQLATAYTALANRGQIVAPALIEEIVDADGNVVYRHQPQVLRRVFEASTVAQLLPMLESVVDSGTATDAALGTFSMAGKSGTARRTVGGRYGDRLYTSSFVGIFPARDPQYVILAKIDNPRNESIYGGKVAAPLAKAVIQGALAARDASLDWGQLVPQKEIAPPQPVAALTESTVEEQGIQESNGLGSVRTEGTQLAVSSDVPEREPVTFDLSTAPEAPGVERREGVVPDVGGLTLRAAVRELHRAGFRVRLVSGEGGITTPPPGTSLRTGSTVRLRRP